MQVNSNIYNSTKPSFGMAVVKVCPELVDPVLKARMSEQDWVAFDKFVESQKDNKINIEINSVGRLLFTNFRSKNTIPFEYMHEEDYFKWYHFKRPSPMKFFERVAKKANELEASVQEYNRQKALKIQQCIEAKKGVKNEGE